MRRFVFGSVALFLLILPPGLASAQLTQFTCEDFITQANAQASLERFPDDPYGLDPDGNGIACEDMVTAGGQIGESGDVEVTPADYEIVEQEFQQVARPRVVLRVIVEDAEDDETAAALAAALADGLENEPGALVGLVFGYREGDDTDGGYTVGIAEGSRDGLGWTGDGVLSLQFDDEDEFGTAFIILDSAVSDSEERQFTVPLVLDDQVSLSAAQEAQQEVGVSAEESAYANEVAAQTELIGSSMATFSELMAAPRLGEDDWTLQLAAVIVTWRSTQEEAEAMTPPSTLAEVHQSYLASLSYLNAAGDDIVAGLDTFDLVLLNQAATNLELATEQLATTEDLINEVLEQRGLR